MVVRPCALLTGTYRAVHDRETGSEPEESADADVDDHARQECERIRPLLIQIQQLTSEDMANLRNAQHRDSQQSDTKLLDVFNNAAV